LFFHLCSFLEAISKIEKWFEDKPPAPLPARRLGPTPSPSYRLYEPEAGGDGAEFEGSQQQIEPFGIPEMVST
jgi:hypothetical protein